MQQWGQATLHKNDDSLSFSSQYLNENALICRGNFHNEKPSLQERLRKFLICQHCKSNQQTRASMIWCPLGKSCFDWIQVKGVFVTLDNLPPGKVAVNTT